MVQWYTCVKSKHIMNKYNSVHNLLYLCVYKDHLCQVKSSLGYVVCHMDIMLLHLVGYTNTLY